MAKKTVQRLPAGVLVLLIAGACFGPPSSAGEQKLLLRLSEGTDGRGTQALQAIFHRYGATIISKYAFADVVIARAEIRHVRGLIRDVQNSGLVEFVVPDEYAGESLIHHTDTVPNDPYWERSWHHRILGMPEAWRLTTGDSSVVIVQCDSGVETDHPDLAPNVVLPGYSAIDGSSNVSPANPHGTRTGGVLAAAGNNSIGVTGVGWHTKFRPVKIRADTAAGPTATAMVGCIDFAIRRGYRVVSSAQDMVRNVAVDAAAKRLREAGGIFVMPVGNNGFHYGRDLPYPNTACPEADCKGILGVGATDENDNKTPFSNSGAMVDLVAPGVRIPSTDVGGGYLPQVSGTSISAPIVAGVIGLMLSVNPSLTVDQIESILFATAVDLGEPGRDDLFGHGRVNAAAAVKAALDLRKVGDTIRLRPGA